MLNTEATPTNDKSVQKNHLLYNNYFPQAFNVT